MEVPAHFAMTAAQTEAVLRGLELVDLVTVHADGLLATPLPLFFDPSVGVSGALLGHVARNNRQWSTPTTGEALAIARTTDHYVSPAWLPSTDEHGKVVPTWDYVTVHVYGELIAHDDAGWTAAVVRRLTERHEAAGVAPATRAWSVDDAPADYVTAMMRAIVGIELRITRVEAKAKMAQNKAPADVAALAKALAAHGDREGERWLREVSQPAADRRAAALADVADLAARRRG